MRLIFRMMILVVGGTLLPACGGGRGPRPDAGAMTLAVTPTRTFTAVGGNRQMSVLATTPGGSHYEPSGTIWTSSDPGIATVSADGLVLGIAPGTTSIVATAVGATARADLEVYAALTPARPQTLSLENSVTCALAEDGRAICWGNALYGAIGHPPYYTQARTVPEPVLDDHIFTSITVGPEEACATTAAGEIYCWGSNDDGVLGVGAHPPPPPAGESLGHRPVRVDSTEHFVSVTAGLSHVCALNDAGRAFCWGGDRLGQLGIASAPDDCGTPLMARQCARAPIPAATDWTFVSLHASGNRTCGLTAQRTFYCWGLLDLGEGGGSDVRPWREDVLGPYHRCAIDALGDAYCWGARLSGELGSTGPFRTCAQDPLGIQHDCLTEPRLVEGGLHFASLSATEDHTCGVTTDGAALCWGYNTSGELGNGTTASAMTPVSVSGGHTFASVVVDQTHACGITQTGTMYCWGNDEYGQLGDGATTEVHSTVPVAVIGGFVFAR